ncbi:MAG: ABC transporter substrate-binding protein, partial [Bradyrhizobiaceae bacterium]|nr:ABC transporter substrate-binding protein [Bradyrhizobiaceae bacterium]
MLYNRPPFTIAVKADSPIKTPKDLEGKTIGAPPTTARSSRSPPSARSPRSTAPKSTSPTCSRICASRCVSHRLNRALERRFFRNCRAIAARLRNAMSTPSAAVHGCRLQTRKARRGAQLGNPHYTDVCHTYELKRIDCRCDFSHFHQQRPSALASPLLAYRLLD